MRVLVCPADDGGCGHYRLRWPAAVLQAHGHDVMLSEDGSEERADDFDVVVFQRPLKRALVEHIPTLQAAGVAVVVEVDDDFSCIPVGNIAREKCHPSADTERNWNWLSTACRQADLVTVTTSALARRYGHHGRVAVLPNYVPARYLDIEPVITYQPGPEPGSVMLSDISAAKLRGRGVVGWSGSVQTHVGDLEVTRGGVARAIDATGATFAVVGTGVGVQARLGLSAQPLTTGWQELELYPEALAQLDVGIVPLADSAFNRSKSWLKGLEFASLGVPFVASPLPEYERLHKLGVGMLAHNPRQWEQAIKTLVGNDGLRAEMAHHGRAVAEHMTIEANAHRWAEAWERAWTRRKVAA